MQSFEISADDEKRWEKRHFKPKRRSFHWKQSLTPVSPTPCVANKQQRVLRDLRCLHKSRPERKQSCAPHVCDRVLRRAPPNLGWGRSNIPALLCQVTKLLGDGRDLSEIETDLLVTAPSILAAGDTKHANRRVDRLENAGEYQVIFCNNRFVRLGRDVF